MTTHVHIFCNRCGREIDQQIERSTKLERTTRYGDARTVPTGAIDLCDGCDEGFHRWLGDRVKP